MFCRLIREFDLILYLANKAIPDKNGDLDILNHMVRPRNTCSQALYLTMATANSQNTRNAVTSVGSGLQGVQGPIATAIRDSTGNPVTVRGTGPLRAQGPLAGYNDPPLTSLMMEKRRNTTPLKVFRGWKVAVWLVWALLCLNRERLLHQQRGSWRQVRGGAVMDPRYKVDILEKIY